MSWVVGYARGLPKLKRFEKGAVDTITHHCNDEGQYSCYNPFLTFNFYCILKFQNIIFMQFI
jgi:hypothetical protein